MPAVPASTPPLSLAPFSAWCQAQAVVSPLELTVDPNNPKYRYMARTADFKPSKSKSESRFTDVITAPLSAGLQAPTCAELADKLSYEFSLGDDSKFAPWLALMPTLAQFKVALPRFWDDKRLEFIAKHDNGQLQQFLLHDAVRLTTVNDSRALACVDSRSNFLPDKTFALTPLLDMFNHDPTRATTGKLIDVIDKYDNHVEQSLVLSVALPSQQQTKSEFESKPLWNVFGQPQGNKLTSNEICISYGDLTNLDTLVNYGFCQEDNPCNRESIAISVTGHSPVLLDIDQTGALETIVNEFPLATLQHDMAEVMKVDLSTELSPETEKFILEETYAFIASGLEEASYDAKEGAQIALKESDDVVVASYLNGRAKTLAAGVEWIHDHFPHLF